LTPVKAMARTMASDVAMAEAPRHRNRMPVSAKRIGLAAGGALAGTLAAVYPIEAGLAFVDAHAMVAAFCFLGALAGFLDAEVQPQAATRPAVAAGVKRADSAQMLSAFGTLFANSAALLAAWLVVFEAPAKTPWAITVGFWWLFGATAQISAGILARVRVVDPDVA